MKTNAILAFVLVVSLFFTYGNFHAEKRGPLDNPIMDQTDLAVKMDKEVEKLGIEGLFTGEAILFVIPFWEGLTKDELIFVREFSEDLREWFPEYGVIDLTNSVDYKYFEDSFGTDPYLSDKVYDEDFDIESWKGNLNSNILSKNFLIGGEYKCSFIRLLLPRGFNEPLVYEQVKEFLEGRKASIFSKKTDIDLADKYRLTLSSGESKEHVFPMGWTMGRGLVSEANKADVMNYSTFGILAAWVAFALFLISLRQAIIATSIILISFVWINGSIWLMQLLSIAVYLRVYIILVYSAIIVSGISFAERKFNAYNRVRQDNPELSIREAWAKSKSVNEIISLTAIIAILNFLSLYFMRVTAIWEVGILSALGIVYLWALTIFFIPALHNVFGGEKYNKKSSSFQFVGVQVNKLMQKCVAACYYLLDRETDKEYSYKKTAFVCTSLTMFLAVVAVFLVSLDYTKWVEKDFDFIEVRTKPLEYFQETIIYRGYKYLEEINYGFENINICVRNKNENGEIYDPEFLKRLKLFTERIKEHPEAQDVFSALDGVNIISKEQYSREIPASEQEVYDAFMLLGDDYGPMIKEQLWYDKGLVLSVSVLMDDSKDLGGLIEYILDLANSEFQDLDITTFGKASLWPKTDYYISTGKPWNVLSSFWIVLAITAIWVAKRNIMMRDKVTGMNPVMTGFAISLPFIFASAIMTIAMMVLRLPLDQATACSASLAVSAAVDFGLYPIGDYQKAIMMGASRREALQFALLERGDVVMADVILNCICFFPLTQSSFLPIERLGWVMVAMLIACGFGSLVIMMSFLPCCVNNKQKEIVCVS